MKTIETYHFRSNVAALMEDENITDAPMSTAVRVTNDTHHRTVEIEATVQARYDSNTAYRAQVADPALRPAISEALQQTLTEQLGEDTVEALCYNDLVGSMATYVTNTLDQRASSRHTQTRQLSYPDLPDPVLRRLEVLADEILVGKLMEPEDLISVVIEATPEDTDPIPTTVEQTLHSETLHILADYDHPDQTWHIAVAVPVILNIAVYPGTSQPTVRHLGAHHSIVGWRPLSGIDATHTPASPQPFHDLHEALVRDHHSLAMHLYQKARRG